MSGPQEPPSIEKIPRPRAGLDKGKGKMPEYEVDNPDHNDSDVSAPSIHNQFGVPIMGTPGVKKALTLANERLPRSSQEKNPITWFGHNEYMAHHYVFRRQPNKSVKGLQAFFIGLWGRNRNCCGKAEERRKSNRS